MLVQSLQACVLRSDINLLRSSSSIRPVNVIAGFTTAYTCGLSLP